MNFLIRLILLCLSITLLYAFLSSLLISYKMKTSSYEKNINGFECRQCGRSSLRYDTNNEKGELESAALGSESGERLFYNRVPKCGSTTLYTLLKKLSRLNSFKHYNSKIYDKRMLDFKQQERLIEELMQYSTPYSYDRHIFYIDFRQHKVANPPIYINMIREPVDRIISSYYYRRSAALKQTYLNSTKRIKPSDSWIKKPFERCVLSGDPECTYIANKSYPVLTVPYFCGQSSKCLLLNENWALEWAKRNIERSYAVIGILEQMDKTLDVLEDRLPKFFAGVSKLYLERKQILNKNENKKRRENVSNEVIECLKANLTNEYELYGFAVQRLYRQYNQIVKHKQYSNH